MNTLLEDAISRKIGSSDVITV